MSDLINLIRHKFLQKTFEYIKLNKNYYKPHYDLVIKDTPFDQFPFIDKELVATHADCFLFKIRSPFLTLFTGATTGRPLVIFKSEAEIEHTRRFFSKYFGPPRGNNFLVIDNGHHGKYQSSFDKTAFYFPLQNTAHAELILQLLQNGMGTPGGRLAFDNLALSALSAKVFFSFLIERIERLPSNLKIVVSGSYLTSKWKKIITEYFSLKCTQEYGLTEFSQGNAWLCSDCNSFHFPPTVYPELEELDVGNLALSSLFPFSQAMVLLRYKTGDIFVRTETCDSYDDYGYRFVGRKAYSTGDVSQSGLLTSAMVAEVLESKDWVFNVEYNTAASAVKAYVRFKLEEVTVDTHKLTIETTSKNIDLRELKDEILQKSYEFTGMPPRLTLIIHIVEPHALKNNYFRY
jgi:phenylacetate-coenzyme A ligase PaaK-like adenylate-forming protein